eukprot:2050242-Rhodomonas_salina.1
MRETHSPPTREALSSYARNTALLRAFRYPPMRTFRYLPTRCYTLIPTPTPSDCAIYRRACCAMSTVLSFFSQSFSPPPFFLLAVLLSAADVARGGTRPMTRRYRHPPHPQPLRPRPRPRPASVQLNVPKGWCLEADIVCVLCCWRVLVLGSYYAMSGTDAACARPGHANPAGSGGGWSELRHQGTPQTEQTEESAFMIPSVN